MRLSPKAGLWLILGVSLALRVWLAAGGGQGYWPDENMRYGESQTAAAHLLQGEWGGGAKELFGHADHLRRLRVHQGRVAEVRVQPTA